MQFASVGDSTNLLLSSPSISNVNYDITCSINSHGESCASGESLVLASTNNSEVTNIELRSVEGTYQVCLLLVDNLRPANVTLMKYSKATFQYASPYEYSLVTVRPEERIVLEVNSRPGMQTLFEVFECTGEVNVAVLSDYKSINSSEDVGRTLTQTAGHYAIGLVGSE